MFDVTNMYTYLCSKWHKFWVMLIIEFIKYPHVLAVAQKPVDGRKVLTLSQLLVQSPKYLNNSNAHIK